MSAPEYLKIAQYIKDKIIKQELNPGDIIPSENYLCEQFDVSRMTVRKSLAVLVNDGYIYSVPGKGNYVNEPNVNEYVLHYDEMIPDPDEEGCEVRLLQVNVELPSYEVGYHLHIPQSKHVVVIKRLFMQGSFPAAYDIKYMPYYRGIPIVEKEISYATFPEMVAQRKSPFAMIKKLKVRSVLADEDISTQLEVPIHSPLLVVEELLLDNQEVPFGWGVVYLPGESASLDAVASYE